jgi:predicted transcriptional regulator of viral defense system
MKYAKEFEKIFGSQEYPVFNIKDIKLAFEKKAISYSYIRLMLSKYAKSKKIKRITRGTYTFHDDAIVTGFAFRPFYYGLESALNMLGFSMQGINNIIITTRNVRRGVRSFEGRNYRVQPIKKTYFFGYKLILYNGFWVPVSDLEKTVIDMLYFNIAIRPELHQKIVDNIDKKKLLEYLKRYNSNFKNKVIENLNLD